MNSLAPPQSRAAHTEPGIAGARRGSSGNPQLSILTLKTVSFSNSVLPISSYIVPLEKARNAVRF